MARAALVQSSFLGGEWNPAAQGRFDHPWYKTALNVCINAVPIEEGAWQRRSGTMFLAPTYNNRSHAEVRTVYNDSAHRYAIALTTNGSTGWAHFFHNDAILVTAVTGTVTSSSSSGGILTLGFGSSLAVADGDWVILSSVTTAAAQYLNRVMTVETGGGTNSITLKDDEGNVFGFDSSSNALNGVVVNQILRLTHGIVTNLPAVQVINLGVQQLGQPIEALIVCAGNPAQLLSLTGTSPDTFTLATADFIDGPYLDPSTDTGTVSAYTGSITFTPAAYVFVSTDVGRLIRLFTQPAAWVSGTTYSNGQFVTDANGAWWEAVLGTAGTNVGITPGTLFTTSTGAQVLAWSPAPTAGTWAWGTITAQVGSSATVSLTTNLNSANGTSVQKYRLGLFGTPGIKGPGNGILAEGRLWLGGGAEGRLDASNSNALLTFSPTDPNNNVFDNLSLELNISSQSQDMVTWFAPVKEGLEFGTVLGEYLLSAGAGTAITPSNFQLVQASSYGSSGTPAVIAGVSTLFLQVYGTRMIEYVVDVFATAPSGRHLNEFSKHLAANGGFTWLAYQEEKCPILWLKHADGRLIGCTYRRFSRFMSQPPDYAAWHQHWIADSLRLVQSLCVVPGVQGDTSDYLYLTTSGSIGLLNQIELMQPLFGEV